MRQFFALSAVLLGLGVSQPADAAKVFVTPYESQAKFKVFLVNYESQADGLLSALQRNPALKAEHKCLLIRGHSPVVGET